jgi:hypothetical protein
MQWGKGATYKQRPACHRASRASADVAFARDDVEQRALAAANAAADDGAATTRQLKGKWQPKGAAGGGTR